MGRLGSIFSKLILKLEHNSLENKELQKSLHQSNETIQYLSQTIDTFQNLFNYTSNTKNLNIKQFLYKLIEFIQESPKFENINIKADEIEEIILNTNENELSQILLSVLVNAKDALIQNNIKNPYIKISTINTQKTLSIKVEDNGGGIQIKPIEKIFEPHFSNKENGSGLGLYIAKTLAQKNGMELTIENIDGGACFILSFRLK